MTELDLRETLRHRLDGTDVPPGDPWAAIARGRRRRHRRTALVVGLTAGAVVALPVAVMAGGDEGGRAYDPIASSPSPTAPSTGVVLPGGTETEVLGDAVVETEKGSATVLLPEPPAGATAVSMSVTCLDPGRVAYPDGASMVCGDADVAGPEQGPRAQSSYVLDLSDPAVGYPRAAGRTLAFTATAGMSWKLSVTYVRTTTLPWGVNAQGQTYGVENDQGRPDLVAVVATDGRSGYAFAAELDGPMPTSPADALAQASAYPDGRDIAVYASDGRTRIGTFHQEPGTSSER